MTSDLARRRRHARRPTCAMSSASGCARSSPTAAPRRRRTGAADVAGAGHQPGGRDLEGCARLASRWERAGSPRRCSLPESTSSAARSTPFRSSTREIIRAHARVYGDDPFTGVTIAAADLRRACETQIKSHLLHLREGFIEAAAGRPLSRRWSAPRRRRSRRCCGTSHASTTSLLPNRVEATARVRAPPACTTHRSVELLALERPAAIPAGDPARLFPGLPRGRRAHGATSWTRGGSNATRPESVSRAACACASPPRCSRRPRSRAQDPAAGADAAGQRFRRRHRRRRAQRAWTR